MTQPTHDERAVLNAAKAIKLKINRERRQAVKAHRAPEKGSRGRERNNGYLAFLRRQPCAVCRASAPNDAAHLRMASPERGKRPTGMQVKPSDRFAVPLCRACHTTQHSGSEARFWSERGMDPFAIADRLFAEFSGPTRKASRNIEREQ